MEQTNGRVRFVRINGRVIPLRGKGSAPKGVSKRYGAKREIPKGRSLGMGAGSAIGSAIGFASSLSLNKVTSSLTGKSTRSIGLAYGKRASAKHAILGASIGAFIGSMRFIKRGKGESNKQLALRASGDKARRKKGV